MSRRHARALTCFGLAATTAMAVLGASKASHALPSFPGAEGFGAGATGGRMGQVIKVTTLDATGPGSLQEALDTQGPRIIVFTVSGVIEGDITITHGDVTIAGQTAPGAGITIAGRLFAAYEADVTNMIVRFLRVRPVYSGGPGEQFDAAQLSLNENFILDHMTISWGVDETVDLYSASDVTIQWSTIEESATAGHPEGEHNYGLINGPDGYGISVHHNLFVHHKNRNPAIANGPAEVLNNVVYNVRHGFVHHNPASGPFNIVGNVYIQGPNDDLIPFFFDDENGYTDPGLSYFLADNYVDDPGDFVGVVDNPWSQPHQHESFAYLGPDESFRAEALHDFGGSTAGYVPVTTQASSAVLALVREKAGAFPRDVVTLRVLDELDSRGGSWGVEQPSDLLDGLTPGQYPADADDDGMPDAWETEHGLDPNDGTDHVTVMPSGYSAIEDYINGLADELSGGIPSGGSGSGASGSGGSGSGSGANGTGGTADDRLGGGGHEDDSGCGCRTAPSSTSWPLWVLLGLASLVVGRRRAADQRARLTVAS